MTEERQILTLFFTSRAIVKPCTKYRKGIKTKCFKLAYHAPVIEYLYSSAAYLFPWSYEWRIDKMTNRCLKNRIKKYNLALHYTKMACIRLKIIVAGNSQSRDRVDICCVTGRISHAGSLHCSCTNRGRVLQGGNVHGMARIKPQLVAGPRKIVYL